MPLTRPEVRERGATAVLIAISLLLLMGIAAIAIDVGFALNERRQDVTAADMSVMAGALEGSFLAPNNEVSAQALLLARSNLAEPFGDPSDPNDPAWVELWRACSDPGKDASFFPLPEPSGWSGVVTTTPSVGTLDCISRSASFLRVRIPDQAVDTSFGRVLGASEIRTNALAVALLGAGANNAPILPYGISGSAGPGEVCLGNAPSGTAFPPCNGPSSGTFGTLLSEFFGDFYGSVGCGNPGATEIATGTALGIDHFVSAWINDGTVTFGSPHPGDGAVLALPDTNRDACNATGGVAVAVDGVPINTVRVDSGFPSNPMESGLVSNNTFFGRPSRLQQSGMHLASGTPTANSKRPIIASRQGANLTVWNLDNHGPWDYLVNSASSVSPACNPATYGTLPDEFAKAARFNSCLSAYMASPSKPVIFNDLLDDSPRFAWAPQYWYRLPTTGLSWEPVHSYQMIFVAGTWFNCSAGACGVVFYPDAAQTSEHCDASGPSNCTQLNLHQFSAWFLPPSAVPEEIRNAFPEGQTPVVPSLWR